jgi:3-dehydroquinate synthase
MKLIHDKKNESGIIQFTLLNSIGNFIINQTVDNEIISRSFFDYKT